jgi:hypothetical protein
MKAQRVRLAGIRFLGRGRCRRDLKAGYHRHQRPKYRNVHGAGLHETFCKACGTTAELRAASPSRRRRP